MVYMFMTILTLGKKKILIITGLFFKSVNLIMVSTYFEKGRIIVELEQEG